MIQLLLILVLIGVVLYLIETYIPMSPPIKTVIRIVVVVCVVLYLLQIFGVGDLPLPRLHR